MPSCNKWMTLIIGGGNPKRENASQGHVRSTEWHALCSSIKHMFSMTAFLARPNSCSRRTTNVMSMVDDLRQHPHNSSGKRSPLAQKVFNLLATEIVSVSGIRCSGTLWNTPHLKLQDLSAPEPWDTQYFGSRILQDPAYSAADALRTLDI